MNNKRNNIKGVCYLCLTVALTFIFTCGYGQSVSDLEKQIESAKKAIEKANHMLETNDSKQLSSQEKLSLIKSQVNNRSKIITNMRSQSRLVQNNISRNQSTINKLTEEHNKLKKEYANYMTISYKNYIFNNSLLFIFSAKDFSELQMRIYYLKRYSQMRYDMAIDMENKATDIKAQNDSLSVKRKEYDKITQKTQQEVAQLDKENKRYNNELNNLKQERTKLFKDIKTNQDNIKKVQNKISQIIAEEARRQKEIAAKASKEDIAKFTKETSNFVEMKGRLPHPTSRGIITERFGTHPHSVHQKLMVPNKGVNYQVPANSDITAVFNGVVSRIFFMQGTNNSIMIRHGNYITTYSGLTEVFVKKGDILSTGQKIGTIKDGGMLHFELWYAPTSGKLDYYNPEIWLKD